ncbi:MAG: HEAT repeat domain-containing protein [Gemmatimonadota bacterium]|nr:HEAT repeat domain-containing protein [Gemmatimonadota bacterium]
MTDSLIFVRHLARLVWLLLFESRDFEAQLSTLAAMMRVRRSGSVALGARDWRLSVNGSVPAEPIGAGQDLAAQLIGHSLSEVIIDPAATLSEVLALAQLLATAPKPGDGGRDAVARLNALQVRGIRIVVEQSQIAPDPIPRIPVPTLQRFLAQQPPPESQVADDPSSLAAQHLRDLDAARSTAELVKVLESVVRLATESARKQRADLVIELVHGMILRERSAADPAGRRQLAIALRRVLTPVLLRCVAALLPRRKESYDPCMAIVARADEAGAEALVEALVAAGSIPDRRVYFDSLVNLRSAVPTLLHMVGDDRWYVARNAANLLGLLRASEAESALARLLEHEDHRVRAAASAALAKIGTPGAARHLRTALRDATRETRDGASDAMTDGRRSSAVTALLGSLERERDPAVQIAVVTILGRLGGDEVAERLVAIATGERKVFRRSPTVRVAAVHALGEIDSPATRSVLSALLRDKEKAIRGAASWEMLRRKTVAASLVEP